MAFFTVDKNKCSGDGACVADCPIRILKMDSELRVPFMIDKGKDLCIRCGHCVAVCPHGAISLEDMPVESCRLLQQDWRIIPEKLENFLKARRSIRNYKEEPVDRKTIESLIDIARFAPSGINRQPARWMIVYEREKVRALAECVITWMRGMIEEASPLAESLHMKNIVTAWEREDDWICRKAPHLVISYALKDDLTASQACTIALTYLELAAASYGVGACWAGYVAMAISMSPYVKKAAGISDKANCYGAMMIGYPKFNYSRIPSRNKPHIVWK